MTAKAALVTTKVDLDESPQRAKKNTRTQALDALFEMTKGSRRPQKAAKKEITKIKVVPKSSPFMMKKQGDSDSSQDSWCRETSEKIPNQVHTSDAPKILSVRNQDLKITEEKTFGTWLKGFFT